MKYSIIQILNAYSLYNLVKEIEVTSIHKNINEMKKIDKYKEILKDITFNEDGFSIELENQIEMAILNHECTLTPQGFLQFCISNSLRTKIFSDLRDNSGIYHNFMDDFININIERYKVKKLELCRN